MQEGPLALIIGTRPEGIKMAPVYHALKKAGIPVVVISTMQHDQLLTNVLDLFHIVPDYALDIMRPGQDLFYLTQSVLQKTKQIYADIKPSLVLVQGDTTSSMAAALAAFYMHIPVGHVEAGLRTDDIYAPFPEEMNRRVISVIARYHFAPTQAAVINAVAHGVRRSQLFCTGNTVVDALHYIKNKILHNDIAVRDDIRTRVQQCKQAGKKLLVLTMHRRESFSEGIQRVLQAIRELVHEHEQLLCIYPYHPNPHVLQAIDAVCLRTVERICIMEPLSYVDMVYLLDNADMVLTDSGGIQEEAISLLKPVLVLREKTERMEGVLTGLAQLVGTDAQIIKQRVQQILHNGAPPMMHDTENTYGDGHAAEAIVAIVQQEIKKGSIPAIIAGYSSIKSNVMVAKKEQIMKTVCVVGLGYIGLPTAIMVAESGYKVVGVDINTDRVRSINAGDPDIHEPDMYEKLQLVLATDMLYATTTIAVADYFIIAVPTPLTHDTKPDLSHVFSAATAIATVLQRGNVVILESTVTVGTTEKLAQALQVATGLVAGQDFFVVHSPERVLPGKIFHELVHNDRIIGGINQESAVRAQVLYKRFVQGALFATDAATAEMVKLIENSARDVEIAFAHQVASMCYAQGLDPYRVIELVNQHPRVKLLKPTCGVGGHCLAVDPWFLVDSFPEHTSLIAAARTINDAKPHEVIARVDQVIEEWQKIHDRPCVLALFGLTYKANVDDLRESPALFIAQQYSVRTDIQVMICEPYVKKNGVPLGLQPLLTNITQATQKADLLVFLVAHDQFKIIDVTRLPDKKIADFCGLLYRSDTAVVQAQELFWPALKIDRISDPIFSEPVSEVAYKEDV
jgi:UDP-N-acetylglucosamine 2-epimerase (non-hydrolysing)